MHTNGKPTTQRTKNSHYRFPEPPKSHPMTKVEQLNHQMAEKMALVKQKQELDMERMLGKVAAFNSAIPVIQTALGDPNNNLDMLTNVIIQRGCDCVEDCIEIIIEDQD